MLEQFLRARLPEQLIALIEKIESVEQTSDASHLRTVWEVLDRRGLTWFERAMLRRVVFRYERAIALNMIMEIVIDSPARKQVKITRVVK
jgi:hypothetical protein